jgi:hypothetical protein
MSLQLIYCEQGSREWAVARLAIPTASRFADILAHGDGKTRRKYLLSLAGEMLIGEPMATFSNHRMERGRFLEAEARERYAFKYDVEPQPVGFIRNGRAGASPDALLDGSGVLEIKTALPSILIEKLLRDEFPPEHRAQTQGELWIAEREWVDLAIYHPRLPLFVKRAARDEAYIRTLAAAVDRFNEELDLTVDMVRRCGDPDGLRKALTASLAEPTSGP